MTTKAWLVARRALARAGEVTGAGAVARAAVEAHDEAIARLIARARELDVPEPTIARAVRGYGRAQRVQNLVALLLPFVPSPAALRALAGK